MAAIARSKESGRKRSLASLNMDEFMAYSSSEDGGEMGMMAYWPESSSVKRTKITTMHMSKASLEDNSFLQQGDENLLNVDLSDFSDTVEEEEEEGVGMVEPRPLFITSYKHKEVDSDDVSPEEEEERGEQEEEEEEEVNGGKEEVEMGESKEQVTLVMIRKWVKSVVKIHSLSMLRRLCGSLHSAIRDLLPQDQQSDVSLPSLHSVPTISSSVFNALVAACFQHVPHTLHHHLPMTTPLRGKGVCLPSSKGSWRRVRAMVRQYLCDLLDLVRHLQDTAMQCSVLKQIHAMGLYSVCFPKLLKKMNKVLVSKWCAGGSHVQVLAFLCLRKLVLYQPHPAMHLLLKKVYLAFVANCKFTSATNLPGIKFMINSLVELLAIDPPTTYQHGFVYIRQLALHLRTAMTAGKKDSQQAVYNWQFLHCLGLWSAALCEVHHPTLRPLLYPLVQVVIASIQLQPSTKYHPIRLHLVRLLQLLASSTDTYIPTTPYLLELLEEHGVDGKRKLKSGKPPDLSVVLRANSTQLSSRPFRVALVNDTFQQLLQYFVQYSHYISFPELVFPTLVRLKQICKVTCYSWLKAQLKQLIAKVEEVCANTSRERLKVTFSPKHSDLVTSWEKQQKMKATSLSRFLTTWNKMNSLAQATSSNGRSKTYDQKHRIQSNNSSMDTSASLHSTEDKEASDDEGSDEDEGSDIVQDLNILSD